MPRMKKMTPEKRVVVAYHEAGHALVGWMLEHTDRLVKVTIVPRKGSLGSVHFDTSGSKNYSKEELFDRMCMALGGCAAESIIFKSITKGGFDDVRKVLETVYAQIEIYGISEEVGLAASFSELNISSKSSLSKSSKKLIDLEAKKQIIKAYLRSKELLLNNQKKLNWMAERLLQKETLYFRDVERILGPSPFSHKKVVEPVASKPNVKVLEAVASPETASTTVSTNGAPAVKPMPSFSLEIYI